MKIFSLIIATLIPVICFSQNWQFLNTTYRYNYQTDTSAFISNTIVVDSVSIENGDSVFYLNRIARPVLNQWWDNYAITNLPQFLQRRAIKKTNGFYHFTDTLSFCINPYLSLNDTWLFDTSSNITATIIQVENGALLGVTDSLKTIILSTNDTIILSKNYGIVRFPNGFGQDHYYELKGVEGPNIGIKVPGFWEFFDFNVGDVFQYSCGVWSTQGRRDVYTRRIKIISKTISVDTILYNTERFVQGYYLDTYGQVLYEPYSYYESPQYEYVFNKMDLYSTFINQLSIIDNYDISSYYSYNITSSYCINQSSTSNAYVIQNLKEDSSGIFKECYNDIYLSNDTSVCFYSCNSERIHISFKPGLGKVTHYIEGFEWGSAENLEGYVKNGDTVGTVSSIEELEQKYSQLNCSIYPNPASEKIFIKVGGVSFSTNIFDINGRLVKRSEMESEIDISDLTKGLYAIRIHTPKGVVTRKFVKE